MSREDSAATGKMFLHSEKREKAWDGIIVVDSRHYINRRNNKLPNQDDTITASAFRGFVYLTSNLIRDLRIPEHSELH